MGIPFVQVLQLDTQHRRLQGIEPAVESDVVVMVIRAASMHPQREKQFAEVPVIRHDQPAVTHASEVFGREKAEAPRIPEGSGFPTVPAGADGLAGVFNDLEAASIGHLHDGLHVGALPEKMDGNDGLCARRDLPLKLFRIHRKGIGKDVHEHRHRVQTRDAACRGKEGKRHGNDFIAGIHTRRHQGQQQGVASGGHPDGVTAIEILGDGRLKSLDPWTQYKRLCRTDLFDRRQDVATDLPELSL